MQPEKVFVVRGNANDGPCITPHRFARRATARGVCQSCNNTLREGIRAGEYTDAELVARGLWLPKGYTVSQYVKDRLATSA